VSGKEVVSAGSGLYNGSEGAAWYKID